MKEEYVERYSEKVKVKRRFMHTVTLYSKNLVFRGNVSIGINHHRGPHDHAMDDTEMHTINTITIAMGVRTLLVLN